MIIPQYALIHGELVTRLYDNATTCLRKELGSPMLERENPNSWRSYSESYLFHDVQGFSAPRHVYVIICVRRKFLSSTSFDEIKCQYFDVPTPKLPSLWNRQTDIWLCNTLIQTKDNLQQGYTHKTTNQKNSISRNYCRGLFFENK